MPQARAAAHADADGLLQPPAATGLLAVIGRGDPGRQTVIEQERSDADLVVVGKSSSSAWEDFLCGSVAHRVLSWGSSDVLVVPHAYWHRTAPLAAHRIRGAGVRRARELLEGGAR